jgi:hypothetical protein
MHTFVDWINAADPNPTHAITLAEANEDNSAYLVAVEDEQELADWLKGNGEILSRRCVDAGFGADEVAVARSTTITSKTGWPIRMRSTVISSESSIEMRAVTHVIRFCFSLSPIL